MLSRRATSEMRRRFRLGKDFDTVDKFFLLDTAPGFL